MDACRKPLVLWFIRLDGLLLCRQAAGSKGVDMSHLKQLCCSSFLLLLIVSPGAYPGGAGFRSIADVPGIETYKVLARFSVGGPPPFQLIEMDGVYGKVPERYHVRVSVTDKDRDPVIIEALLADGQLYSKFTTNWVAVEKFHLEELVVFTPEHLLGIEGKLTEVGAEDHQGREVVHLRGGKENLPKVVSGSDSIDFSRMESAVLDLWVDQDERFIARVHIAAQAMERGALQPFDVTYEYSGFNEPVTVKKPVDAVVPQNVAPPAPTQADATRALGFEFTIPGGGRVINIVGATVSMITAMPLDDARAYAGEAMRAAGFTPGEEVEQYPGEFYTDYTKGERTVGVLVFQVTDSGATITVGSPKV